ncbi:MAG TPA: cytochrome o ubiquinol oxidase subunit IV [Caulobacteraceae bacterium]|jgi:cytochrome o ubiquinol oxidase operon protein cyoD
MTDSEGAAPPDHAPGDASPEAVGHLTRSYVIGLVLATLLTIAAFSVAAFHIVWGPSVPVALCVLAIAQMGVHLVFFLHITTGPDNTNNVLALAFGILIVGLLMLGSIWIMDHLSHRLMPMSELMQMQR